MNNLQKINQKIHLLDGIQILIKDWKKNGNWEKKEEALPMFDRNKATNAFLFGSTKPKWWLERPNTEVAYNECWHLVVGANTYIRLVPTEEKDDFTLTLAFNTTYNDFSSSCSTTYLMDSRDIIYGWECSECSNKNKWSSFQCNGNDCCSERDAHTKISIGNEIGWHKVGYDKRSENPRWILGHSKRRELKYYDIEAMIQSKEMFQTKTVEEESWGADAVETISWQPVDRVPYDVPNDAIILKKESIPDDVTIIETPCGARSHKPFDCPIEITFLVEGATSSQSDQWQGVVEGASVTRNGATGKFKKAIQTSSGLSISIEAQLSSQFTKDVDLLQWCCNQPQSDSVDVYNFASGAVSLAGAQLKSVTKKPVVHFSAMGCGSGKTYRLKEAIKKKHPDQFILVVVCGRILNKDYAHDLESFGVVSYMKNWDKGETRDEEELCDIVLKGKGLVITWNSFWKLSSVRKKLCKGLVIFDEYNSTRAGLLNTKWHKKKGLDLLKYMHSNATYQFVIDAMLTNADVNFVCECIDKNGKTGKVQKFLTPLLSQPYIRSTYLIEYFYINANMWYIRMYLKFV